MAPVIVKSELAVIDLPAIMVMLLKIMCPVPVLDRIVFPPNVVVLFPAFKIPAPFRVRLPVTVYAELGVRTPVIVTSLKVFVPVPVILVVSAKITLAYDVKVPVTERFPLKVISAPGVATKVPDPDTVNVPATVNEELFAVTVPFAKMVTALRFRVPALLMTVVPPKEAVPVLAGMTNPGPTVRLASTRKPLEMTTLFKKLRLPKVGFVEPERDVPE